MNFLNPALDYCPYGRTSYRPSAWSLAVSIPPDEEPVTLEEVKRQCVVDADDTDDDDYLNELISSARAYVENYTHRAIITQTRVLKLDGFPGGGELIELPGGIVQSAELKYIDQEGAQQEFEDLELVGDGEPAVLVLEYSKSWPAYRRHSLPIEITFIAGYPGTGESPEDLRINVPNDLKLAIKMLVGHWYKNREPVNIGNLTTELEFTVKNLLAPYRIF